MKNWGVKIFLLLLMIGGLVLEMGYQTWWHDIHTTLVSASYWLLGGLMSSVAAFFLLRYQKDEIPLESTARKVLIARGLGVLVVAVMSVLVGIELAQIFALEKYSLVAGHSDVVPSIELYVTRLLGGEKVYAPLDFGSWVVLPTYFPMMWLPYIFSEVLDIDYRWTAFALFIGAILIWQWRLAAKNQPLFEKLLKVALPFAMLLVFAANSDNVFGYAVELTPIAFYIFLCFTLFHKNRGLMAVGIVFCLLSRYAFTFWLPVYLLIFWIEYGFKEVFKLGIYCLIGVFALYIIPFLSKDVTIFTNGLKYYDATALSQWKVQWWQSGDNPKPANLYRGLSYASYFYETYEHLPLEERLAKNKLVHLIICLSAAVLIFIGYLRMRAKGLNIRLYMMVALKFYLVLFYGFFYVPFAYLYMLPLFISIPLIYEMRFSRLN